MAGLLCPEPLQVMPRLLLEAHRAEKCFPQVRCTQEQWVGKEKGLAQDSPGRWQGVVAGK